jgi:hypothetical protein
MIRVIPLIVCLFFSFIAFAQKIDDNRIIVTVSDPSNLYQRVRQAIVNTNLPIREDSNNDTLVTYSERINNLTIFVIAKAIIKSNKVEIFGSYGLGYEDIWTFPGWPKSYKRITYYKESEAWRILRNIAIKLDGKMTYYKEN